MFTTDRHRLSIFLVELFEGLSKQTLDKSKRKENISAFNNFYFRHKQPSNLIQKNKNGNS